MMRQLTLVIGTLWVIGWMGCSKEPLPTTSTNHSVRKNMTTQKVPLVIVSDGVYKNGAKDPLQITNLTIEDEIIMITVTYQGGCGTATFDLVAEEHTTYVNGTPFVKARVALDDRDNCTTLQTKTLFFDVFPLRKAGYNKVFIDISGFGVVSYTY